MKNLILIIIVLISFKSAAQVTSVTGTANQVIASGSTGAVKLSLPQSIATSSAVQFAKLGIDAIGGATSFYNAAPITALVGTNTAYANLTSSEVQSGITTTAHGYKTILSTVASSFNLTSLIHFSASQGIIGAGSTVTNQMGYVAEANLTGAANNYGFYGNIAVGTGRWNLYMNGTASNYLAGNLGIGTTNPTEKLSVNGNIRAKEIRVEVSPWPDYVFQKNYALRSLPEVEKFIQLNQHLPGIPSASAVEKEGLNLGEMNAILLKKIEELTLYIIEQNKRIEKLENKH